MYLLQFILVYRDVVLFTDTSLGHVEIFFVPLGMPKDVLMRKIDTLSLRAPFAKLRLQLLQTEA